MNYKERYNSWLTDPAIDEATKAELRVLTDEKEIEDRFYRNLEFGTAGLRGILGAGTNRMNPYIVGRATEGLARYLSTQSGAAERGVVIAHDSRHMSAEFARRTALVLCAHGIRTYLFPSLRAVPQLSFAIGHLRCAAGVVITASHNPSQYNGYKVYGDNGAQINPSMASEITRCIEGVESFGQVRLIGEEEAKASGLLTILGPEEDEAYYAYTAQQVLDPAVMRAASEFKVVYTPLFGSGNLPVQRMLKDAGITKLYVVKEQQEPNGDFPGLSAPNPEVPEALDRAMALADEVGADLVLATDPDADRLGVAVRNHGSFVTLTGNQIGCLVLHYRLMKLKEQGRLPENGLVVRSIVSTTFADAICAHFGVELQQVLTGFRFIGEKIDQSEKDHRYSFLFGFEESYGFLSGTRVRDKDAICAALMLSETAAWYSTRGMTLYEGLMELYSIFGCYREKVRSYTLGGKAGMEKIAAAMEALRAAPPVAFGAEKVEAVCDYARRCRTSADGESPIALPASNVLYYELGNGNWLCIRPSGTEPKLKVYAGCSAPDEAAADARLTALMNASNALLAPYLA